MRMLRTLWICLQLLAIGAAAAAAPSPFDKSGVSFSTIRFAAARETKGVSFASYAGEDAQIKARFDAGRAAFEQGVLRLNAAGAVSSELKSDFVRQAEVWTTIAADAGLPAELRAAALHNAANCHTVLRDFEQALRHATAAQSTDPAQRLYLLERDAIRDGFYARRSGYNTVTLDAPRLEPVTTPGAVTGVRSSVELGAPRARISPFRTPLQATGAIWINDRKSYRVSHTETVALDTAPLQGVLTLENRSERVVDCRGVLVQASVNGNPVGASARLEFQGDAGRVAPGGRLQASFAVVNPAALPASGTLTITVFDLPATLSAAGVVEARRNDRFEWSIGRASYAIDALNRVVEEKISPEEAALENRPIPRPPRTEALVNPLR